MKPFVLTCDQQLEFKESRYVIIPSLFDAGEMQILLKLAKSGSQRARESYAHKDAAGGDTPLALRNAPFIREGQHPIHTPLEKWPPAKITRTIRQLAEAVM